MCDAPDLARTSKTSSTTVYALLTSGKRLALKTPFVGLPAALRVLSISDLVEDPAPGGVRCVCVCVCVSGSVRAPECVCQVSRVCVDVFVGASVEFVWMCVV